MCRIITSAADTGVERVARGVRLSVRDDGRGFEAGGIPLAALPAPANHRDDGLLTFSDGGAQIGEKEVAVPFDELQVVEDEDGEVDSNEQFGFRLRNGTIQMRLGGSGWQTMTDGGTLGDGGGPSARWETDAVDAVPGRGAKARPAGRARRAGWPHPARARPPAPVRSR